MANKSRNFLCGKCLKNISKSKKAVVCKSKCEQWHHLTCTSLTDEEYKNIARTELKWICAKCTVAEAEEGKDEDTQIILEELTLEVKNQELIMNTLTEDLSQANNEIII